MYKLSPIQYGQTQSLSVIRTTDGACIPFDPENTDYQAYLKWVADGNTPLPAENE
jgi:hypothetical protein